MANAQNNLQPISDDQELAKVLAGVSQDADNAQDAGAGMTYEETGAAAGQPSNDDAQAAADAATQAAATASDEQSVVEPSQAVTTPTEPVAPQTLARGSGELDSIKLAALQELRPLVDKLNVAPEEKFDTYLLLLRSTDDRDLIEPAHEAAKSIEDEARRAQALLDIIKEIDFLSQNN